MRISDWSSDVCSSDLIEAREVKPAMLAVAVLPLVILGFTAIASVLPAGLAGPLNKGPHGFSEILYAFTSGAGNNGSAFAGLSAGTPFYNGLLGIPMWLGRLDRQSTRLNPSTNAEHVCRFVLEKKN